MQCPTRIRHRAFAAAVHTTLAASAVLTLVPLFWMLLVSFLPDGEASRFPPRLLPGNLTLAHYRHLFERLALARHVANSTLVATIATVVSLFTNSAAGYAFARLPFPGRERLFRTLLALLVIPPQVAMLPLFLMVQAVGLVNSYAGVVIPGLASVFGIFLVRQYALSIPESILDAARMDGAGEFRIYWSIVLPTCRPVLVTLAVFTFLGTWNDFLWPLVVLSDSKMHTLPVALANLVGEHVQDTELMMAGSVVTALPVVLLFLLLQRYYIAGIMSGSVKE